MGRERRIPSHHGARPGHGPRPAAGSPPEDVPAWQYVVAFVAYVAVGYHLKSVFLNWIVGPLFLLTTLYLLPLAFRRMLAVARGKR